MFSLYILLLITFISLSNSNYLWVQSISLLYSLSTVNQVIISATISVLNTNSLMAIPKHTLIIWPQWESTSHPLRWLCVCAKSLQWCLILCDPTDCTSARLLCPWDFPGKNTGVGCHLLLQGSSQLRDQTWISYVSCIGREGFYH